ncbi:MAG: glycine-rich domain-containing protein [Desulfuromonadaceae bacterium]
MSTIKTNNVQIGQSATPTNNFVLSVPAVPDGTLKISRGNIGATTQDVLTVAADGTTSIAGVQPALATATQVEMESGTEAGVRVMSPLHVAQAIGALAKGKILRSARTSNTVLGVGDKGAMIDITSGTFTQTFAAAATLGDGWFCYLHNSGTGDITLDPDGAEQIDGLDSYVMYPGEVRLVQCDGVALRTVVVNAFYKTFTSSGTFTKPPGYAQFGAMAWGGGTSGQKSGSASTAAQGGGGGGCFPFTIIASAIGASETVTIASGGAAVTSTGNGLSGGATSLGSLIKVYGGINGDGGSVFESLRSLSTDPVRGFEGADRQAGSVVNLRGIWGGGAAKIDGSLDSGSALYGGAAGGGLSSSAVVRSPGTSVYGGNGGAASSASSGTDGTAPGGGGGATQTGTQSGAGARGELRIWGVI